jgi:DNA-directed RNA polymerase subunit H (RpoH/RPB5)
MTSQNTSILVSSVYKSRKIVLELMDKQGYNTEDYSFFSINEVNSMKLHNQLDMLLEKRDADPSTNRKDKIYIRYYLGKKISNANIQEMIDDLFGVDEVLTKADTIFIIIKDDVNETILNELKHIWEKDGIFIVVENIKRLQFNILNHTLVPPHSVMTANEVTEVMKKYNLTNINEFPDISRFDPVAKVIGIRPGQVCHIVRPSKTAIKADYYRVCV